jgi:predicted dehydrogenase
MVRQRNVFCEGLAPAERQTMRDRLFTDLLPLSTVTATQGNAIAEEQGDFAAAIQTGRAPRVTGEQGRAALAAAEAVELAIARHTWREPTSATHVGRDVLPGPHANNPPTAPVPPRNQRKAG